MTTDQLHYIRIPKGQGARAEAVRMTYVLADRPWTDVMHSFAEELANALLEWLQRRGFPPQTIGDPKLGTRWHHAVTHFVCHLVLADVRQARKRAERRRA